MDLMHLNDILNQEWIIKTQIDRIKTIVTDISFRKNILHFEYKACHGPVKMGISLDRIETIRILGKRAMTINELKIEIEKGKKNKRFIL